MKNGELQIYPEIAARGYFDITYLKGQLVMRTRGWVGLIPISDEVAIHVHSRAPISNLLYMVWRARVTPQRIQNFLRTYRADAATIDSPEELYADTFLSTLRQIHQHGPIKRYAPRQSTEAKRGRLLLSKTVSQFAAKGNRHKHVFEINDFTVDNPENRVIKYTAQRLYSYFQKEPTAYNKPIARDALGFLQLLSQVRQDAVHPAMIARLIAPLVRALPKDHSFYEPALWLAYLIVSRSSIALESFGRAKFETVIINVAEVFEAYVRQLCREASQTHFGNANVLDGNKSPIPLFVASSTPAKPDIYFSRGSQMLAVADVKYKPTPKAQDHYELLAFCNALNVHDAVFICPWLPDTSLTTTLGRTTSGIQVSIARINLSSTDMPMAENQLQINIATLLRLTPHSVFATP
ncbi:MAG: hypothetical protein HY867_13560 [Chloroflexi bacterium]|nr:hypothetical protein [Chloroflexota bacterium]